MSRSNLTMNRAAALSAIGGAVALASGCGSPAGPSVSVGSKDFTEELILGEMYAQILEHGGFDVDRTKLDLGGTQIAMEALQRGDIDLYPEYTGTALITELKATPSRDAAANFATVKREYAARYHLTWLEPSPFNDTQALATTHAIAARYRMRTLSDLATAAPHLRLGAIPEFTKRPDGLPGLQKTYGGFQFADVKLFEIGLKYKALETGQVDVVVAFGTDGQIDVDHLLLFIDDKHLWPTYQAAPVVREATLAKYPQIAGLLNTLAPKLTDAIMRGLNAQVDGERKDPKDVAHAFLSQHGLA